MSAVGSYSKYDISYYGIVLGVGISIVVLDTYTQPQDLCQDSYHVTPLLVRTVASCQLLYVLMNELVWECLTAVCKALSLANAKGKGTDGLVIIS